MLKPSDKLSFRHRKGVSISIFIVVQIPEIQDLSSSRAQTRILSISTNTSAPLSRGVAELLAMRRYFIGKQPGGCSNLTFPRMDEKPGIFRTVPSCKNETTFWDCLAQQVLY